MTGTMILDFQYLSEYAARALMAPEFLLMALALVAYYMGENDA